MQAAPLVFWGLLTRQLAYESPTALPLALPCQKTEPSGQCQVPGLSRLDAPIQKYVSGLGSVMALAVLTTHSSSDGDSILTKAISSKPQRELLWDHERIVEQNK